jgi:hypothetical protein
MKRFITLCGVVALVAALACEDRVHAPTPTPEPTGAESPAEALEAVELSFNERAIKVLASALSEDFVFYFDPRDVGSNPPGSQYRIPESWSYTEFWQALNNMFRQAYSINLAIPTGRVGSPGENETTYKAENVRISLLVMIDSLNGFIADGGYCNFAFERYDAASGKKYWRLTGWWDRSSEFFDAYPALTPTSVGKILAALQ